MAAGARVRQATTEALISELHGRQYDWEVLERAGLRFNSVKHLELLSPDYDGYWSDTEYSWRTYKRGEVIPAGHIKFWHDHPLFTGAASDAEYWRQQNPEAERRGRAIFACRNPDAVAAGW